MKIYLTKMILNPLSRRVFTEVGNPQQLHKTISRGFPAIENPVDAKHHERKTPRNEYSILHRLDIDINRGKAFLLVQSTREPDWSFLDGEFADEIKIKEVEDKYQAIKNGMNLIFRLQANPTKRIGKSDAQAKDKFKPSGNKTIRRRVELRTDEERTDWLARQGERFGFQIANLKIEPAVRNVMSAKEEKISFRKNREKTEITYGSVVFEGVLQVTDADIFREALINGIGQGKAYGFGLLSVAPAAS
jgi:CRISPR system Cascade subunit CasE